MRTRHQNGSILSELLLKSSAALVGDVDAGVFRHKLRDAADSRSFKKNNLLDHVCQPKDPAEIIRRASQEIGKPWDFKLLSSNCEHFACTMRYGIAYSGQVDKLHNAVAQDGWAGLVAFGCNVLIKKRI